MITMRISPRSMSFSQVDLAQPTGLQYIPFVMKSGVSIAANLRQALQDVPMLSQGDGRVRVVLDGDTLIVPVQEYDEEQRTELFMHAYPEAQSIMVESNVLPSVNAVALFAVNKDLATVLRDHYQQISYVTLMQPVWRQLYQRNFTGNRRKLYAYFHDQHVEVCVFQQGRFAFTNRYRQTSQMDVIFYLLHVWQTLGFDAHEDELYIIGKPLTDHRQLIDELHRYVVNVYNVNPVGEYNRAPITQIPNLPYDLMTLYVKGR